MKHLIFASCLMLFTVAGFHCGTSQKTDTVKLPAFDREGHRGCRGLMPENTIPAMKHAIDLNVTTLEMDATITKDNQVILSHEPFFNHQITTKPDGSFISEEEEHSYNIHSMDYDSVVKYDVGLKPYPHFPRQQKLAAVKPLLKDVISEAEAYARQINHAPLFYNIETKTKPETDSVYHPGPAEFVETLMKVVNDGGIADRTIIQSFDFRTLQYLHQHFPEMMTAMLIEDYDKRSIDEQLKDLGFTPTIYSPARELVNEDLIKKCHAEGMKVIPWTVNSKEEIDSLRQMGVDGVITDYPDLF